MKTTALLISLFLALAVSPAFGNSIVHLPNQAGFVWINNYIVTGGPDPGSHWMIFGEAVPVHNGYNYSFGVGDSTDGIHFSQGSFYDALGTAAGTTIYLGTLYHSVFDVKSGMLKGVFAGYEKMLNPNGSLLSSVKIHGVFVESLSFPGGIASGALTYGNVGIGNLSISSTPEPRHTRDDGNWPARNRWRGTPQSGVPEPGAAGTGKRLKVSLCWSGYDKIGLQFELYEAF